ncbi:hypothetical protein [Pseudomonas faucium]|uniref:hypothetical protein n=1 Tax=Pseudomonas faucium TaxID=2740518 RepID=UPI0039C3C442
MFVEIDSKTSRAILKSISYGLPYDPSGLHRDTAMMASRLSDLRHKYNGVRISRGRKEAPISNYLFYLMLKDKYAEFDFEFRQPCKQVLTNIHKFKTGGRIPSLAALLLSDAIKTKSEMELKYDDVLSESGFKDEIAALLQGSDVMAPTPRSMAQLVSTLQACRQHGAALTLISAICPDYAYLRDASGKPQYTFHSVGQGTGLAGDKLIRAGAAIKAFGEATGLPIEHTLYGGEFEYKSFYKGACSDQQRADFLKKVNTQLCTIGQQLQTASAVGSFFEKCGGEPGWVAQHAAITERIRSGDLGQTGLTRHGLLEIFESRQPLYSKWFPHAAEEEIWQNFTSQAAEYALMGKFFHEQHGRHVVVAVDHFRMEPFYSYFHAASVLYIKTDYL